MSRDAITEFIFFLTLDMIFIYGVPAATVRIFIVWSCEWVSVFFHLHVFLCSSIVIIYL